MADNQRTRYTGRDAPFLSDGDPLAELARIAGFDQPEEQVVEQHSTSAEDADASAFDLEAELMRSIGLEDAPEITPETVEIQPSESHQPVELSEEEIPAFLKARPAPVESDAPPATENTPPVLVEEPVMASAADEALPDQSGLADELLMAEPSVPEVDLQSAANAELAIDQRLEAVGESAPAGETDDAVAAEAELEASPSAPIELAEEATIEAEFGGVEEFDAPEFDATEEAQLSDEILRSFDEDLETALLDEPAVEAWEPATASSPLPALAAYAQPADTSALTDFSALDTSDDDAVWREMVQYALPGNEAQAVAAAPAVMAPEQVETAPVEPEYHDAGIVAEEAPFEPVAAEPIAAAVAPAPLVDDGHWDIADELEAAFADYGSPKAEPAAEVTVPEAEVEPLAPTVEYSEDLSHPIEEDLTEAYEALPFQAEEQNTGAYAEPVALEAEAFEPAVGAEDAYYESSDEPAVAFAPEPQPEPEIELDFSALENLDFDEPQDLFHNEPVYTPAYEALSFTPEAPEAPQPDPFIEELTITDLEFDEPAPSESAAEQESVDIEPVSSADPSISDGQDINFDFSDFEFELQDVGAADPVPAEHAAAPDQANEAPVAEDASWQDQPSEPIIQPAPIAAAAAAVAAAPTLASLLGRRASDPAPARAEPVRNDYSRVESQRSEPARPEPTRIEPTRIEPARIEPARQEALSFEAAIASRPKPIRQEPAAPAVLPFEFHDVADTSDVIEPVREIEVPDLPEDEEVPRADTSDDFDLSGLEAEFADILARNEPNEAAEPSTAQNSAASAVVIPLAAARPEAARPLPDQIDFTDFDFGQATRPSSTAPDHDNERDVDDISFADLERGEIAPGAVAQGAAARRPAWKTGAAALAIIAAAGLAAYAFMGSPGGDSGEPRIIAASEEPIKVAPEDPGGRTVPNQDQAVYGQVDGSSANGDDINLISRAEEPVDVVQRTVDPNVLPLEGRPFSGGAPEDDMDVMDEDVAGLGEGNLAMRGAVSDEDPLGVAPRMVRTSVVRADGTLVPAAPVDLSAAADVPVVGQDAQLPGDEAAGIASISDQAALDATQLIAAAEAGAGLTDGTAQVPADQAAAASPAPGVPLPQPRPDAASAPAVASERLQAEVPAASAESVAPVRTVQTTTFSNPAQPTPGDRPADQPVTIVGQTSPAAGQAPQPAAPAEQPVQTAAVAQSGALDNPGGYVVQIASQPTQESAQSTYNSLASRYGSIIGGRQVQIQAAEIPDRGTFYRVRVAGGSREEAVALCERYQAAGGSCFVAR
ncbi:SPOR domain-containing protein [Georhizobium sp. MAB10]|uniref:SPOR domain-containing protein n=1 Tax=Georhizobium sp. MAB10 TaxID=3028319 RepID=UPI003855D5B0